MNTISKTKPAPNKRAPISERTIMLLNVQSACRCQFRGCNADLSKDVLTSRKVNLAHIAHIVAAKCDGPRGDDPMPVEERNHISNLMLVCMVHHKIIDDKSQEVDFPKELLLDHKKEHENRIAALTSISAERQTVVLRMFGRIRGNMVNVPGNEVSKTVFESEGRYPFYMQGADQIEIDLSSLPENDEHAYWQSAKAIITDVLRTQVFPGIEKGRIKHLSVFSLSRISLLAFFGYELGDKVPVDLYQKHRDTNEGWNWQASGQPVEFIFKTLRNGSDKKKVALLLSVSGKVPENEVPLIPYEGYTVYEISPVKVQPGRTLISTKADLMNFRNSYQAFLRQVERVHGSSAELHLFPAVPAPVAVICGRELLRGVSPVVTLHEKNTDTYYPTININQHDTE